MTMNNSLTEQMAKSQGVISRQGWSERVVLGEKSGVDLSHRLQLIDCDLQGSSFLGIRMSGADLRGTNLRGSELLQVDLQDADLSSSPSGRVTDLTQVNLLRSNLQRAQLQRAILRAADLEGSDLTDANLQGAILTGSNLANVRLSRTRLDRSSLGSKIRQETAGKFLDAKLAYLELKTNFLSIGAYDDAGWAYVRERTMARKSWYPWSCKRFYSEELEQTREHLAIRLSSRFSSWSTGCPLFTQIGRRLGTVAFFLKYFWKWFWDSLLAAPWGYGQHPRNALVICAIIVGAFALVFGFIGGVQATAGRTPGALEYLLYSAGSFVGAGFNDLTPSTLLAKYLSIGEAFLGLATFALLVNALGQRIGGR